MSIQGIQTDIADKAGLDKSDDGTFSLTDDEGNTFLVEIKVHDVTEKA